MEPERARELLAAERRRVEQALERITRDEPDGELSNLDQHPGDAGTDMFERERDEGLADSLREELNALTRAEQRLEDGTYGLSVDSGEPIPDARLEAMPFAERTVEEEARLPR